MLLAILDNGSSTRPKTPNLFRFFVNFVLILRILVENKVGTYGTGLYKVIMWLDNVAKLQ